VNLPLPANDSSFVVPKSAVVNSTQTVFVVRVNKGQAEWVTVKTGREAGGLVEIFGDLQPGDQIVKTATDEIRNGSALSHTQLVTP
jgi:multidrug efflux pump subunit AcrA (membrane-fusion protein)